MADRIFAILGTAVHTVLEQGAPEDSIVEERLHMEIDGLKISGAIDLQTPTPLGIILADYKTARASAITYNPEGKPEWETQLNCYAALARSNGKAVAGLEVVAVLRDWMAATAERAEGYPQHPVVRVEIPLWSADRAMDYIQERVALHREYDPTCTDDEMWKRPGHWKGFNTTKAGTRRKRASHLFTTESDAQLWTMDGEGRELERVDDIYTRCDKYCNVAKFCKQNYRRNNVS